jgi:hypothetical protein
MEKANMDDTDSMGGDMESAKTDDVENGEGMDKA